MPPLPIFQYVIIALLVANATFFSLWRMAVQDMQLVEARSGVAAELSKRVIAEQKQITEDTTNAWKAALDTTRNDWARRLRNANVQPMPGISGPTGGIDGLATDSLALAAQCAETTEQLITLQGWIRKQEKVK
jgi:hypothetical protein